MLTDRDIGLVIATLGVAAWLWVWVLDGNVVARVPVPVFVALAVGMLAVRYIAAHDPPLARFLSQFTVSIVAGLGLIFAWRSTRHRLAARRRRAVRTDGR